MLTTSGDTFTESIKAIRHPTLVVAGELDPYCPPKASKMITNAIPNSSYLSIPDVGHCLHWEAADATNDLISQFVNDNSQANKEFNREGL
jgi:pimeloyl-ACP methyl ester carboxylesterase